jgi:glycosyltransferase involved in cell wall biosynthesis
MNSNKIKVSVIVPVYNTEAYVQEAIESICRQTLRELEVIVVDDGSTDHSLEVVHRLAEADPRLHVYTQENQGLSVTRNTGLGHARGKYVYFMDSDDWLEAEALEQCYHACEKLRLDFVIFDAQSFADSGPTAEMPTLSYRHSVLPPGEVTTGTTLFDAQLRAEAFTPSACLSFLRRSFLEEERLRFYPGILHEDQLFSATLYLTAQRVACIPSAFFHRRMRPDSIMTRHFSRRNLHGYLTVTEEVLKLRTGLPSPGAKKTVDRYLRQMLNAVAWQAHVLPTKQRYWLAALLSQRYRRYVSARNLLVLLFKPHPTHKPPRP